MRKLRVFNHVSLDGYFADENGDMSWAHASDPEWNQFVNENASRGGAFVFGRITYEMMASFWPTKMALEQMPQVAETMNGRPKYVFSHTLPEATWQNTTLIKSDPPGAIRKLKAEPGPDLMIFGSGTIVSQLTAAGLIDEYQLVVHPIVLGSGRSLFEGVPNRLPLERRATRTFGNGNVLLRYERPAL